MFFPIQQLQNISVTNNSVIINKGLIYRDSCVSEPAYKKYQKFGFKLKYFFPLFTSSKKSYILITDEWSKNYCHWMWESMSKLIDLKKTFPEANLIIPGSYLKIDFISKSLAALGFTGNKIVTIASKSKLLVKNLAFIPCINIASPHYYDFLKFHEVANHLTTFYKDKLTTNFGERIYISRSNPKKNTPRKVSNEKELTTLLTKYGFKTVYMEDFSFLDQISIAYHARIFIAAHGAGITNTMFAKKTPYLIELINQGWGETCFAAMCKKTNAGYTRIDCNSISNDSSKELSDIQVDLDHLEKQLNSLCK